MTKKKEKILQTALSLFAEKGFDATSTSKVAKAAGVSEGLIFRHFGNKERLLQAILELGNEKAQQLFSEVFSQDDPKKVLRDFLALPFHIGQDQYHFWKLLYALKWQTDVYADNISAPLKASLAETFEKLDYPDPEAEAAAMLMLMDGIATAVLLHRPENHEPVLRSLLNKYDL